jgi:hypothetical protein
MRIPFFRRKQTRKQRLAEAFVRMMENWSKQK